MDVPVCFDWEYMLEQKTTEASPTYDRKDFVGCQHGRFPTQIRDNIRIVLAINSGIYSGIRDIGHKRYDPPQRIYSRVEPHELPEYHLRKALKGIFET